MSDSKNPTDRYFAARPKDKIGESLANRLELECQAGEISSRAEAYATAYEHYYGFDLGRGPTFGITRGGDQGELSEIRINRARSILKSFLSLVIGPRVNWRPQAANGAQGARIATTLSLNLLEYYWKTKQGERVFALMAEMGLAFSESFVFSQWDTTLGPVVNVDPETDRAVRGGDIRYRNLLPWDVIRDAKSPSWDDTKWKFIRVWENKWDVYKQFPKDVLDQPTKDEILRTSTDEQMKIATPMVAAESDYIPVWYFFHDPSPSLPDGMEVVFVNGRCVLRYRKLTYGTPEERSTPLVRFAFDEMFGTPFGYSSWWDTLAPQELMDGLETAIATNQLTLATQSIAIPKGTEVSSNDVTGMKEYHYPPDAKGPEGINLVKTPAEVFNHLKQKAADQQQLMNLNDTFRGQPDTAQMNAQAFTVLATQAISQNGPVQRGAMNAIAQLGTKTIQTIAWRVTDERKVRITGKQQKYLYSEETYSGGMLSCISEVFVDIGNPIEQTAAGRLTLAQMYQNMKQQNGEPVTVEQVQQVIDTGRLEPVIQSARDEQNLIESENDKLSQGQTVVAHALDNHLLHGRENLRPILNPEGRGDAGVNKATTEHLHQHYCLYYGLPIAQGSTAYDTAFADPEYFVRMRIMLGQQPPMPAQPVGNGTPVPQDGAQSVMAPNQQPQTPMANMPAANPPSPVPTMVPASDLPLM